VFNFPFEVEHIVPIALEGLDSETNWALACRSCNLRKSTHVSGSDPESEAVVLLFHPRRDRWEEHFWTPSEDGRIEGLTATGRVTVSRLRMNSEAQMAARRQWMRLGLFP
jgi:HNH endonuclease